MTLKAKASDRERAMTLCPELMAIAAELTLYEDLLRRWQKTINLVAPATLDQIWTRHFADSAQARAAAPWARVWADLGSGAGFPGLVTALLLKDAPGSVVHLIESDQRKAAFLRAVSRETAAPVEIHAGRIADSLPVISPMPEAISARALAPLAAGAAVGLRVNPGISHSNYDLADPARRHSRLGVTDPAEVHELVGEVDGLMFHFNCENDDVDELLAALDTIGERFCAGLRTFAERFGVQVYLEPGEAVVTGSTELVTTVVDVVTNELSVAIVDAAVEPHMPDHLIYGTSPRLAAPVAGTHRVQIAGRTCLAGDVFGEYSVAEPLRVGDEVRFADAAGYTMVKNSWFNGIARPAIVVRRLDGTTDVVRQFDYEDFESDLS